tara:strand:- start:1323 stop:1457 length:135 start_codon:yes stop_codon:yes gene_type:complete
MKNTIEIKPSENKDHHKISINGVKLGEWERSQLRHLIETIDNAI